MGKKPPPPKPEELIEKLDEKVNNHHNFHINFCRTLKLGSLKIDTRHILNSYDVSSLWSQVSGMKEELSGLIGELKNDVDDKGTKIEEDRKAIQFSKITTQPNSICISQLSPQNYSRKSVFLTGKPRRQLLRRSTMNSKRSGRSLRRKVLFCSFFLSFLFVFALFHFCSQ